VRRPTRIPPPPSPHPIPPQVPALVKILRKLVTAGFAPEYDVGGVTDPFLQVKILRLLRILGRGNAAASETMSPLLAQVRGRTHSLSHSPRLAPGTARGSVAGVARTLHSPPPPSDARWPPTRRA
jgi:hypothetical protein